MTDDDGTGALHYRGVNEFSLDLSCGTVPVPFQESLRPGKLLRRGCEAGEDQWDLAWMDTKLAPKPQLRGMARLVLTRQVVV